MKIQQNAKTFPKELRAGFEGRRVVHLIAAILGQLGPAPPSGVLAGDGLLPVAVAVVELRPRVLAPVRWPDAICKYIYLTNK